MHRTRYLALWLARTLVPAAAMSCAGPAAAQSILLCGKAGAAEEAGRLDVAAEALAGTYRCAEEGVSITLRLDADGHFEQRFDAEPGVFGEAERAEFEAAGLAGRWRLERGTLYLFERPERAPAIELVETAHDPAVWMRVEVREADGRPARGLFVGDGPDANPRSSLDDGVLIVPKDYSWAPGPRQIVRTGDELALASFTPARDGANVFRFTYRPSEVEPFEIRAQPVDAAGGAIAVPFGIGGALLRRVAPEN